jgi:tripartite-type tricarboxylate transporter receptor subunit TctC
MSSTRLLRIALGAALCASAALGALPALAAGYPDHPIKMIVPFPPGGVVGTIAFSISKKMGERLGQPVVPEYKPGAGGTIAAALAARSPKDGYTIFFGTSATQGIAKFMYRELAYDPINDFAPIAYLGNVTIGVFGSQKAGITSLDELLARAKAKPGEVNFSSPGIGSTSHLAGELFKTRAKLDIVHVPYPSAVPQMTDLVMGNTQIGFGGVAAGITYTYDGSVKLIAVAAKARSKAYPNVPALAEVIPGYDAPAWLGLVAPAGTPQDALDKLAAAAQWALTQPEVKTLFDQQGVDVEPMTARAFGEKMRRDMALWEEAVKASGVKPQEAK